MLSGSGLECSNFPWMVNPLTLINGSRLSFPFPPCFPLLFLSIHPLSTLCLHLCYSTLVSPRKKKRGTQDWMHAILTCVSGPGCLVAHKGKLLMKSGPFYVSCISPPTPFPNLLLTHTAAPCSTDWKAETRCSVCEARRVDRNKLIRRTRRSACWMH